MTRKPNILSEQTLAPEGKTCTLEKRNCGVCEAQTGHLAIVNGQFTGRKWAVYEA